MSGLSDVVCLSTSCYLKRFDLPLLRYLSQQISVAQWEYTQSQDEPNSIDVAIVLLHDYLKTREKPVHLIGHGVSGLLGLLYTQKHPERVKSLTLLSVGVYPAINWQSQYYYHRQVLPCDRYTLLSQMAFHLLGYRDPEILKWLAKLLERELDYSLSPHSLFEQMSIAPARCPVPLLVCGSEDDFVIGVDSLQKWQLWFKESDRLSLLPQGRHFFHYFHAQQAGRQILKFWKLLHHQSIVQKISHTHRAVLS